MNETPSYTEYHPRWYRPRVSTWWWTKRWAYFAFILRELSSVFIAWFVVFTLFQIRAVTLGKGEYDEFLAWSAHPVLIGLNAVSLFFVIVHVVTWFDLTPKAMVVHLGKKRVPGVYLVVGNYIAWVLVSVVVGWLILKG